MMRHSGDRAYQCSEIVTVFYEHDLRTQQIFANLEEISSRSATLLCEQHLSPGHPVAICIKGRDLYGIVASTTYDSILGWFAVVCLEKSSQWSPQWLLPDHALQMGVLERADADQLLGTLVK